MVILLDVTYVQNMSKQVKEANEQFEWRDLLEQRNIKHLSFSILFVVVKNAYISGVIIVEKALASS